MQTTNHDNTAHVGGRSLDGPQSPEPEGTIWIDFGDGGSARWAGLSLPTLDQICAQLETIKPADTLT